MVNFKWIYENFEVDATIMFGRWKYKKVSEISIEDCVWILKNSYRANELVKKSIRNRLAKES